MRNDLTDWISLAECAARLPNTKPGSQVKTITVKRMAERAGLEIRKRDQFYFVYWPDILELYQPVPGKAPKLKRGPRRTLAQQRDMERRMRAVGL